MSGQLNKDPALEPLNYATQSLIASGELKSNIKAVQHHFRIGYNRASKILEHIKYNNSPIK